MSIAQNKKAFVEYEIMEKFEAGLVLTGLEIKAIRSGRTSLAGSFCRVIYSKKGTEAWVVNMHLAGAEEPDRTRKLLLHKSEILNLLGKTQQKGLSLIPLSLYLKKGKAKLEIALARGKKIHDKRETIKSRDINREQARELAK